MFKNVTGSIAPCLVSIINTLISLWLCSGCVVVIFNRQLLGFLKKTNLDPPLRQNYRPVSKFAFNTKICIAKNQKLVAKKLTDALNTLDKFQSGFRKKH